MSFSIIIPTYNEAENILDLIKEIRFSLKSYKNYEILIIDDGSTDNTLKLLKNYKNKFFFNFIKNNKNIGQSFSILNGVKISKYDTIVTIDADGQNNPKDIPKLLEIYNSSKNYSLVGGLRIDRKDNFIKIISSQIANNVRVFVLKDDCLDTGCSLKIFNKKYFLKLPRFDGMHRFLPALFKGYGYKTYFVEVDHRKRIRGKSKYGTFDRLFRGIFDLINVKLMINKINK